MKDNHEQNGIKYYRKIDLAILENQRQFCRNLDLPYIKPAQYYIKFIKYVIILSGCSYFIYYHITKQIDFVEDQKKEILKTIRVNKQLQAKLTQYHKASVTDYVNMSEYYKKEAEKGILEERYNLLKNAEGLVLETCCGAFPNNLCYNTATDVIDSNPGGEIKEKVKSIVAIDNCQELLEIASTLNNKKNAFFYKMDSTELDFDNDVFDTIVDTFGLQSCFNPQRQLTEMVRVCKPGGKILLLEIGESFWFTINYNLVNKFIKSKGDYGSILFWNWDSFINSNKEIEIIKKKRKINGLLYYYELRKKVEDKSDSTKINAPSEINKTQINKNSKI